MTGSAILRTTNLNVRFGGVYAVNDVSLSVKTGSIHGLIGPNGAGKSTLFNAISGFVPIAAGKIHFNDVDLTGGPPHRRSAFGIQRTFQSVQLVRSMTVLENILVGLHGDTVIRPSVWPLFGVHKGRRAVELATIVAERFGLEDSLSLEVGNLSFHHQRLTEVARAVVSQPRLLMLDEPAGGLSPKEIEEFEQLLLQLRSEMGLTILLVEHVISLVMKVCDLISVLETGRLIASGTGAEISENEQVINAYLGGTLDA
jgi:ABC-type branched-subunit amino acid transport system ATPase component